MFLIRRLEDRIVLDGAAGLDAADFVEEHDSLFNGDTDQHGPDTDQGTDQAAGQDAGQDTFAPDQPYDPDSSDPDIPAYADNADADNVDPGLRVIAVASNVADGQILIDSARDNVVVVKFDSGSTSYDELFEEIADSLDGERADSIAFASHGNNGSFEIVAGKTINTDSINSEVAEFWHDIGNLLTDSGRIDILACNTAGTDSGLELIQTIENISGRNVAGSTDSTGNSSLGGDWVLETDNVDLVSTYFTPDISSYGGLLAAPQFTLLDASPVYIEGGPAVVIDNNVTVSDADLDALNTGSGDYNGAVITLQRKDASNNDDVFTIPAGGNITVTGSNILAGGNVIGSFTNSIGVLAITFSNSAATPTTALVNEVLQSITYNNRHNNPPSSIIVGYSVNDGTGSTDTDSITVAITQSNDPPSFGGLDASPTFTEGGSEVVLDSNATVNDSELDYLNAGSGNYDDAVLTVQRTGTASPYDSFDIPTGGNLTVTGGDIQVNGNTVAIFSNNVGVLTVTFTDANSEIPTNALVNEILQAITYQNSNNNPDSTVSLKYVIDDGDGATNAGGITVNVTAVNDEPSFADLDATPTYVEYGAAVQLDTNATMADPDLDNLNSGNGNYSGATLTLQRQTTASSYDVFAIPTSGNLTVGASSITAGGAVIATYTNTDGVLTITFTDNYGSIPTTAYANEIMQAVTYSNSNINPETGVTIEYKIDDSSGSATKTATGTVAVTVTPVNDQPILGGVDATPAYTEGTPAVTLDSNVSISDIELDALNSGIGDYDGSSLTVQRSGGANADDLFEVSTSGSITVSSGNIQNNGKTVASYTSTSGLLTISFTNANSQTPTTALANEIIQAIKYSNVSDTPPANATLQYIFDDGSGAGNATDTGALSVSITSINDAPYFDTLGGSTTFTEDGGPVAVDSSATIVDPELDALNSGDGDYNGAVLTLQRNGGANAEDLFDIATGGNITAAAGNISLTTGGNVIATYSSVNGLLTINFINTNGAAPTTALAGEILKAITYDNQNNNPSGTINIDYKIDDGSSSLTATGTGAVTISFVAANDTPVMAGLDSTPSFTEGGSAVVLDNNGTISDADLDDLNSGSGDYTGATLTLRRNGGANGEDLVEIPTGGNITVDSSTIKTGGNTFATYTNTSGTLLISFTNSGTIPTTALVNEVLNALTYKSLDSSPPATVQMQYVFDDGSSSSTKSATGNITITMTGTNDAPSFSGLDANPTYVENGSAVQLDSNVIVVDPEFDSENSGQGDYHGAVLTVARNGAANNDDIFTIPTSGNLTVDSGNITASSNIIATYTMTGGQLQVTFTNANGTIPTKALVSEVAQAIAYKNLHDNPPSSVLLKYTINDGSGINNTGTGTLSVNLTAANDQPSFTDLNDTPTYIENGSAVQLDTDATIVDPELDYLGSGGGDYDDAVITIQRTGTANSEDVFTIETGGNLTVSGGNISTSGNVIATYASTNGLMTVTFTNANSQTPTTALATEILQAIKYHNTNNNPPASVSLSYKFNDGDGAANSTNLGNIAVAITSANDAPTITGLDATNTYVEDSTAVLVDSNVTIADSELDALNSAAGNYNGASIAVARSSGADADDVFDIANGGNISVSGTNIQTGGVTIATYTGAGSSLVITFTNANGTTPTTALANEVVRLITYSNLHDNPPASVALKYIINDGSGAANNTATSTTSVNITPSNDAPVLSGLDNTPTFIENGAAVQLDTNATITDVELDYLGGGLGDYDGTSLVIQRQGGANTDDTFDIPTGGNLTVALGNISSPGGVIATYTMSAGTMTVTFTNANTTPTSALADEVLQAVTYSNSNNNPPANATIQYTFNDGSASDTGTVTVSITAATDAPVITALDTAVTFAENTINTTPQQLDSNATVANPDVTGFNGGSMTVSIAGAHATDTLSIGTNADGDSLIATGIDVRSGTDVYYNDSQIGTVAGGAAGTNLVVTFTTASATDAAVSALMQSVYFQNTSNDPTTDVVAGPRNVGFTFVDADANTNAGDSIAVTITPEADAVTISNLDAASTYAENTVNTTPQQIDADITGSNPDGTGFNGGSLTVAITGVHATDSLLININADNDLNQLTGIDIRNTNEVYYNNAQIGTYAGGTAGANLVVTFTTVAADNTAIEALMQAVTYQSSSNNPAGDGVAGPRNFTFTLVDAESDSASSTTAITITPENDAPVLLNLDAAKTFTENLLNSIPQQLDTDISVSNPDGSGFNGGTMTVAITGSHASDTLSIGTNTDGDAVQTTGIDVRNTNEVYYNDTQIGTLAGGTAGSNLVITFTSTSATDAAATALANAITFQNSSDDPAGDGVDGPRDITITVVDAETETSGGNTIAVTITPEAEVPLVSNLDSTKTITQSALAAAPQQLDSDVTVTHPDGRDYDTGSLTAVITGAHATDDLFIDTNADSDGSSLTGIDIRNGNEVYYNNDIIGTYAGGNAGSNLVVSFTTADATDAAATALLRAIFFDNSSTSPATDGVDGPRDITFTLVDDIGGSSVGNAIAVAITSANAAPVLTSIDNNPVFVKDGTAVLLDDSGTVQDSELDPLNSGNGNYNGASLTINRSGGPNTEDALDVLSGGNLTIANGNITAGGSVMATYTNAAGQLQISYTSANGTTPTTALVNEVMRAVTYANTSSSPPATAVMEYTFNDGSASSTATTTDSLTVTIQVPAVPGPPAPPDQGSIYGTSEPAPEPVAETAEREPATTCGSAYEPIIEPTAVVPFLERENPVQQLYGTFPSMGMSDLRGIPVFRLQETDVEYQAEDVFTQASRMLEGILEDDGFGPAPFRYNNADGSRMVEDGLREKDLFEEEEEIIVVKPDIFGEGL